MKKGKGERGKQRLSPFSGVTIKIHGKAKNCKWQEKNARN